MRNPNTKRGLARLYVVLWLLWVLLGLVQYHKDILTSIGFSYWLPTVELARSSELHRGSLRERYSSPVHPLEVFGGVSREDLDRVYKDQAIAETQQFLKAFFLFPLLLGVLFATGYRLVLWVLHGFHPNS